MTTKVPIHAIDDKITNITDINNIVVEIVNPIIALSDRTEYRLSVCNHTLV
jgi:hypothetical protein